MVSRFFGVGVFGMVFLLSALNPPSAQASSADLTQLSLEELMNVNVYSASKKPERFFDTAASVYVITPEDIRRSGATSIPELLRMVPGLSVQKINSHTWDISARGFNGSIFANKLLVIMDGRAVYSPLLGGVFWELQNTLLEDIDRIEVIRGPGGTLWGANAVNGVINIITKKAANTQGGYVEVGGGSEERDFSSLRYGGQSGEWFYRTYAKYFDRDEGFRTTKTSNDEWQMARTGFKAEKNNLTLQGDFYQGYLGQRVNLTSFNPPYNTPYDQAATAQGGNFLTRYEQEDWSLQAYWQETNENFQTLKERRDTMDLEYTGHKIIAFNQEASWGLGYRLNLEDIAETQTLAIENPSQADQIFSLFLQDEIKMLDDRLKLIFGSKLEHNIYTQYEIEPNVRLSYEINEENMVWAAASRAIRTPSRLEESGRSLSGTSAPTFLTSLQGADNLTSEKMRSYEIGYRTQPHENFFLDLSAFADHYDHLITYVPTSTYTQNGFLVIPYTAANGLEGEIYGLEAATELKLREWWKMKGSYTFTKMNIMTNQGITNIGVEDYLENSVPRHNAYVRSSFDLPYKIELDATLRYMDSFASGGIPSNTQLDLNIGKKIQQWDVSIVGQNLLRPHHKESYVGVSSSTTQIERSYYLKLSRKF